MSQWYIVDYLKYGLFKILLRYLWSSGMCHTTDIYHYCNCCHQDQKSNGRRYTIQNSTQRETQHYQRVRGKGTWNNALKWCPKYMIYNLQKVEFRKLRLDLTSYMFLNFSCSHSYFLPFFFCFPTTAEMILFNFTYFCRAGKPLI